MLHSLAIVLSRLRYRTFAPSLSYFCIFAILRVGRKSEDAKVGYWSYIGIPYIFCYNNEYLLHSSSTLCTLLSHCLLIVCTSAGEHINPDHAGVCEQRCADHRGVPKAVADGRRARDSRLRYSRLLVGRPVGKEAQGVHRPRRLVSAMWR